MALAEQQTRFIMKTTEVAEQFSLGLEELIRLKAIYDDLAAAPNPPTTEDVEAQFGFTLAQFVAAMNGVEAFEALRDNATPTTGDWGAVFNIIRSL